MSERAVALLSGGMDSAVAAAWARAEGHPLVALTVDYGQRQRAELAAASAVARWLGVAEHVLLRVDLRAIGGSALTADIPVPEGRPRAAGEIPATYVPARNTVLLALALALAETRSARLLLLGVNRIDYSGYPDCRPEFLAAFERLAALGTRAGAEGEHFRIAAPLVDLSKAEIVRLGSRLGVPFEATLSCYDPLSDGRHCGRCDSCRLRCAGFAEAGLPDPTNYARMPS